MVVPQSEPRLYLILTDNLFRNSTDTKSKSAVDQMFVTLSLLYLKI